MPNTENATPRGDPEKSRGELNEGRPHPTPDIPAGDYPTENDQVHRHKGDLGDALLQPIGPYSRDKQSGENPEVDDTPQGGAPHK
jgi:hypothetical protein